MELKLKNFNVVIFSPDLSIDLAKNRKYLEIEMKAKWERDLERKYSERFRYLIEAMAEEYKSLEPYLGESNDIRIAFSVTLEK